VYTKTLYRYFFDQVVVQEIIVRKLNIQNCRFYVINWLHDVTCWACTLSTSETSIKTFILGCDDPDVMVAMKIFFS
jgi:hypothetical protein